MFFIWQYFVLRCSLETVLFCLLNKRHTNFFHLHSALIFFDKSIVSFGINTAWELKNYPPQPMRNPWSGGLSHKANYFGGKVILPYKQYLKESIMLMLAPYFFAILSLIIKNRNKRPKHFYNDSLVTQVSFQTIIPSVWNRF